MLLAGGGGGGGGGAEKESVKRRGREGREYLVFVRTPGLCSLLKYFELSNYLPGSSNRTFTSVRESQSHFLTFCASHCILGRNKRKTYI